MRALWNRFRSASWTLIAAICLGAILWGYWLSALLGWAVDLALYLFHLIAG